jgi:hypothetical protein|tara:strand:- start:2357 stop:2572 length:216 start_codon:yes stop_codon:yes gene_type:complete
MSNPKEELLTQIEKQMDLFQTTAGKANANIISTFTIIFNNMAQTIITQRDMIEKLQMEKANTKTPDISLKK